MAIPERVLGFGFAALIGFWWTAQSIRKGQIWAWDGRTIYTRSGNPFHFYAWIFFYALITTLFLGAAVLFFLYPDASLSPTTKYLDSKLIDE